MGEPDGASRRKAEIVAAAKRLFATNGYDGTTIQEIADEVGMLKGSLYYHVASKEEILTLTVAGFVGASAVVLRYAQESGGGPRRRLRRFVAARRALNVYDWQGAAIVADSSRSLREAGVHRSLAEATTMDTQFLSDLLAVGERDGLFRLSGDRANVARRILDVVTGSRMTPGRSFSGVAIDDDAHACAAFVLAAVDGAPTPEGGG